MKQYMADKIRNVAIAGHEFHGSAQILFGEFAGECAHIVVIPGGALGGGYLELVEVFHGESVVAVGKGYFHRSLGSPVQTDAAT